MKTFLRIVRALFIRLVFIAFSLLCIWRVTFVSDNKFYWLMMISVGFLLIETAVLLWLRAGKEFRGVLPSVLFFLACVLPSIWIISVDEANRKVKFHHMATYQEPSIRDYVLSLELVNKNAKFGHFHHTAQSPRLLHNSSSSTPMTKWPTSTPTANVPITTPAIMNALVLGDLELAKRAAPKLSHRVKQSGSNHANSKSSNSIVSTKVIERGSFVGVECCDVKISYWFREDSFQNLFFQTLMLILCVSRWLITRAELNLNQRSLILVISVATAADTLDFFGYLGMQMVYSSWHLLYSVLLIVSLSLVQFVFLHVEDECLTSGSGIASSGAHAFTSAPTKTGNSFENDTDSGGAGGDGMGNDDELDKGDKMSGGGLKKKSSKLPIFQRQYEFLKRHLKAEESLKKPISLNRFGHHMGFQMPLQPSHRKSAFANCVCSTLCCCLNHRDPLLFILLASIFLHDGSYLTFRLFALTKLGLDFILLDRPLLIFFLAKNVLIICTQIYKVYAASGERRERKIVESYRELMMAAAQQQPPPPSSQDAFNTPSGGFLPMSQSAAIAAAATGGQIPLIGGLSCFQANAAAAAANAAMAQQSQMSQSFYNQQGNNQLPISSTNNPYRFAQLYNDPFSANKPSNQSQSTLGRPNQNYFSHTSNTLPYSSNGHNKSGNKSNLMDTTTTNTVVAGAPGHQYYQNNGSTISYQSQAYQPPSSLTSPYTESLLGMMNKEFNNQSYSFKIQQQNQLAQHYDSNITMCPPPQNPKQNKGLYMQQQQQQQSFIAGARAKTGPVESSTNMFSHSNNFRNSGSYLPSNYNSNSGKILKASKI